ncbi:GyrI-like domain-containing protein [Pinibacter soli]|uniref:GyrI-like domain-containing protein n=1 Tax=Pinibacter soli TaxID=3044211 RepID=A0ABT6RJ65_9BACT|nr:GyrI-like domain-containing protein [Pinibacter soli]MDI3322613.1 GyrI-like domain-containing protein [Pinibacter soli]
MQVKTMPPMTVLYYTTRTTFAGLEDIIGKVPQELQNEANRLQLFISGPQYWFYFGADGKPDTEFTLEVALPIKGDVNQSSAYQFKHLSPFKCVAATHEGGWDQLHLTYGKIIPWLFSQGMQMANDLECREMYVNVDFEEQENNLTEVLVGIK